MAVRTFAPVRIADSDVASSGARERRSSEGQGQANQDQWYRPVYVYVNVYVTMSMNNIRSMVPESERGRR